MTSWQCSGCGTWYDSGTVSGCGCCQNRLSMNVFPIPKPIYNTTQPLTMSILPQDDRVYSSSVYMRGTMTNSSCTVAGCNCGTSDVPLHDALGDG